MDIDGSLTPSVRLTPHLGQHFPFADYFAGSFGQHQQKVELLRAELDRLPVEPRLSLRTVKGEPSHSDYGIGRIDDSSSQHGSHAGF